MRGRLITTTETSTYDGDGVRFSRQVGTGPVIRAVTDPTAGLPVTIDDGTRKYVFGLGLAYGVSGTALEVQHADRLGSIRAVTNGTGAVIATYRTDEFGVPTASTGSAGSPFRYTGEPLDASGLTYLRARHYDASIGRFLSRDPFAGVASSPLSLNRYSYVTNNPVTLSDPSGMFAPAVCLVPPATVVCVGAGSAALTPIAAVAGAAMGLVLGEAVSQAPQRASPSTGPSFAEPNADPFLWAQTEKDKLEGLRGGLEDLDTRIAEGGESGQNHWRRNREGIQRKIEVILRRHPAWRNRSSFQLIPQSRGLLQGFTFSPTDEGHEICCAP